MKESFIALNEADQYQILSLYAEANANRVIGIAEKDLWVCWVLQQLFEMPNHLKMAFKGGTSLSKIYNVIDRFSEDIDITLDYRQFEVINSLGLEEGQTAPSKIGSGTLRRINEALKAEVRAYTEDVVAPYLRNQITGLARSELFKVEVSANGEAIKFTYPTVEIETKDYILGYVLIEFGGRNIVDPNQVWHVKPYIADMFEDLVFPSSNVTVLSPERTFWEKATLIHVECNRGVRANAERLSRHWFDLVALANHEIGDKAIQNTPLLIDVVKLKNIFFNASYAHYDQCLNGNFRLMPNDSDIQLLEADFNLMRDSDMIYSLDLTFDQVLKATAEIQDKLNTAIKTNIG